MSEHVRMEIIITADSIESLKHTMVFLEARLAHAENMKSMNFIGASLNEKFAASYEVITGPRVRVSGLEKPRVVSAL